LTGYPAWAPLTAYTVGELVMNTDTNTLYECAIAHTSGSTFSPANWIASTSSSINGGTP
jgi:hypothetical protein